MAEEKSLSAKEELLESLKERAKELNCLYRVEDLLSQRGTSLDDILEGIVAAIPGGWRNPEACVARIILRGRTVQSPRFVDSGWKLEENLMLRDEMIGRITVCSLEPAGQEPFLAEESKLLRTIAEGIERWLQHESLRQTLEQQQREAPTVEWRIILDLLRRTDPKLLARITRKMLYQLAWAGVPAANRIIEEFSLSMRDRAVDENRPLARGIGQDLLELSGQIFAIAAETMSEREILAGIQKWIKEDRSGFLVRILENPASSLAEITNAVERFHHLAPGGVEVSLPRERAFRVSLIRRLLSDHPSYIETAARHISVNDFYDLLRNVIHPTGSHGKLGGKASGLLLASRILRNLGRDNDLLGSVRTPKTWYLTSDVILSFIESNDLEEIIEIKYEDTAHVRQEYPYIVNVFKNSPLPPEIINGLSVALDDFGDKPLIVRSSSLLEDRMGTSFAGKYKSLFLANQGTKQERLNALMDAITEVFASTFGPDPIEYRTEHGLIDFHEEMGVLIQEVCGTRVGRWYLPAFSGVAFCNNDFRWSKRIRREDGLVRMVPGLGTRAVDRVSDDYPILLAPGQPSLRVNVTTDEKIRYSPRKLDVINLESNELETVELRDIIQEAGSDYPLIRQLVSVLRDDRLVEPTLLDFDPETDQVVMTFEGLITRTRVVEQLRTMLDVLQREMRLPVDLEFAHDGTDLYLVQCRPQSYTETSLPATIPGDVERERILFTADRHVSNGTVPGITHVVYVDPHAYSEISDRAELLAIGQAVSRLNSILPKRQFILMGPGRWGSRGDIRLGVSVTYSDINNSAMLIEIARKKKDYVPELSFGTHFFQDLVEAGIRYLPLYPDEDGIVFNDAFLNAAENVLATLVPDFAHLAGSIRVIDVARATNGMTLQVLMNGETEQAMALFTDARPEPLDLLRAPSPFDAVPRVDDSHWQWRLRMVEQMASHLEPRRFGVRGLYVFGSTRNGTAGPASDVDLLVHFDGTVEQRRELAAWLEAWSLCLGELNFFRTGRKSRGLLDVHFVTDRDIERRTSYAAKIGATTDPARPIPLGGR